MKLTISKLVALVMVATMFTVALSACGSKGTDDGLGDISLSGGNIQTDSPATTQQLGENTDAGELKKLIPGDTPNTLAVGETAQIIIGENPTTGFMWEFEIDVDSIVEIISNVYKQDPNPKNYDGVGGTRYITVKAVAPGKAEIAMVCLSGDEVDGTSNFNIVVVTTESVNQDA